MAINIQPIAIPDATVPYTGANITMGISTSVVNGQIQCTASMRAVPYRILSDGTIDEAKDQETITFVYPDVFTSVGTDSDLALAFGTIEAAIQTFLTAKGY